MPMIDDLRSRISPDVRVDEPMSAHTTYRIGGPADFYFESKSAEDTCKAVKAAKELGLPIFVFGGGSNMLVSDEGVRGFTLRLTARNHRIEGTAVIADSGVPSGFLGMRAVEAGLEGLEWAVGLPGTVGGGIRGNAGMFGGEMKDVVESVRVLRDGVEEMLDNAGCQFSYRNSIFKSQPGTFIILAATFRLKPAADVAALKARIQQNLLEKRDKQPVEFACAGCVFANWRPETPEDLETLRRSLDLNKDEQIPLTAVGTVPAGWIIDRAQLKGMKIGHAMVSDKHANFFVHDGQATASDLVSLMAAVKTKVRNMTHGVVSLMEEIEYVGF